MVIQLVFNQMERFFLPSFNHNLWFTLHSRGLQWSKIQEVKDIQGSKLQPYDWYIIRKADDGTPVPSACTDIQRWCKN